MNDAVPGDAKIEMALAYETNPEFKEWLNEHVWQLNHNQHPLQVG